jgi:hypothetical protein
VIDHTIEIARNSFFIRCKIKKVDSFIKPHLSMHQSKCQINAHLLNPNGFR